ncbi:hypothetical protein [Desulfurobacterium sp.]|uniref:hypothetical protein n=1 Tax=Desulfurobacterium sp. TaxID=2004706 RepID=UPI002629E7CB|nr:hypothetical protein [Desulfurobacterium sp.]
MKPIRKFGFLQFVNELYPENIESRDESVKVYRAMNELEFERLERFGIEESYKKDDKKLNNKYFSLDPRYSKMVLLINSTETEQYGDGTHSVIAELLLGLEEDFITTFRYENGYPTFSLSYDVVKSRIVRVKDVRMLDPKDIPSPPPLFMLHFFELIDGLSNPYPIYRHRSWRIVQRRYLLPDIENRVEKVEIRVDRIPFLNYFLKRGIKASIFYPPDSERFLKLRELFIQES